jgi:hypothetical protein
MQQMANHQAVTAKETMGMRYVTPYAQISFEQDFNETAGFVMTKYTEIANYLNVYDTPVASKSADIIRIYKSLGISLEPCR